MPIDIAVLKLDVPIREIFNVDRQVFFDELDQFGVVKIPAVSLQGCGTVELDADLEAALDAWDEISSRPGMALSMDLEPGDLVRALVGERLDEEAMRAWLDRGGLELDPPVDLARARRAGGGR